MANIGFNSVFTTLCNYISALSNLEIYYNLFDIGINATKTLAVDTSTITKFKKGTLTPPKELIAFYNKPDNFNKFVEEIENNVLCHISNKFAFCDELAALIDASSMDTRDRNSLTKYYPGEDESRIAEYIARVIMYSLNNPSKAFSATTDISERIVLSKITPCKNYVGREKEADRLYQLLENEYKVFVYGIGGIGKTEFIKYFCKQYKKAFSNILYLTYSIDLKHTIAEIPFKDDKSRESIESRFDNHSRYLRTAKADTLIIIDNFDILPEDDSYLTELLNYNCKVIFTTRNHFRDDYISFELTELSTDDLLVMAEKANISAPMDNLIRLFDIVHNHTLSCELIMKLLTVCGYSADALLELLSADTLNDYISDKLRTHNTQGKATYSEHILRLFGLLKLSDDQQNVLRLLSLCGIKGIADTYFKRLAELKSFNDVNSLDEMGIVSHADSVISIHPLISEVVYSELRPNLNNCRKFLDNVISEALHMEDNFINLQRYYTVSAIANNVIAHCDNSDTSYYVAFLNQMCDYTQVFSDRFTLERYIDEVGKYIDDIPGWQPKAVHLMNKAALVKLCGGRNVDAKHYTNQAAALISDYLHNISDFFIAFNIYNNLIRFHLDENDLPRATHYADIAKSAYDRYLGIVEAAPEHTIYESEIVFLRNMAELYYKKKDCSLAKRYISEAVMYCKSLNVASAEFYEILMFAVKIYEVDDKFTAMRYSQMANEVLRMLQGEVRYLTTNQKMLN